MLYDAATMPNLSWRIYFQFYKWDRILQAAGCSELPASIYPINSSRGTQYEGSVCYTTVSPSLNCSEEVISNFTNETEYYRLQAVFRSCKSIYPIPSSRGMQYKHCMLYDGSILPKLARRIYFQFYKWDCILQPAGCFELPKFIYPTQSSRKT